MTLKLAEAALANGEKKEAWDMLAAVLPEYIVKAAHQTYKQAPTAGVRLLLKSLKAALALPDDAQQPEPEPENEDDDDKDLQRYVMVVGGAHSSVSNYRALCAEAGYELVYNQFPAPGMTVSGIVVLLGTVQPLKELAAAVAKQFKLALFEASVSKHESALRYALRRLKKKT